MTSLNLQRISRLASFAFVATAAVLAGPSKPIPPAPGSGQDSKIKIDAMLYLDRDAVKQALGVDAGQSIVVVKVTVTPGPDQKIYLDRDDFLLRSDRNGEHIRPLGPSEIAGTAVLVVGSKGGQSGSVGTEQRQVPYGMPYPGGMPGSIPMGGGGIGSATTDTSSATATIEERGTGKPNPLLDALKARVLPEGEIEKPVSGMLYFRIEGKQRIKDMELVYRKAPPRVSVRFIDPEKKK